MQNSALSRKENNNQKKYRKSSIQINENHAVVDSYFVGIFIEKSLELDLWLTLYFSLVDSLLGKILW